MLAGFLTKSSASWATVKSGGKCGLLAHALGMKIQAVRRRPNQSVSDPILDRTFAPDALHEDASRGRYSGSRRAADSRNASHAQRQRIQRLEKLRDCDQRRTRPPSSTRTPSSEPSSKKPLQARRSTSFEQEPLPPDNPLWDMENVLISPHCTDRTADPDWLDLAHARLPGKFRALCARRTAHQRRRQKGRLLMTLESAANTETIPTFSDVQRAADQIGVLARQTPVASSRLFNEASGTESFFKCEQLQRGGAFKIRGATNFLCSLSDEERRRGVVTFFLRQSRAGRCYRGAALRSEGNHRHAHRRSSREAGIHRTIWAGHSSSTIVTKMIARCSPAIFPIVPARSFCLLTIIPGSSPARARPALELVRQQPELDAIVVPLGGGGLLSGTLIAAKTLRPELRVYGVEPGAGKRLVSLTASGRAQNNFVAAHDRRRTAHHHAGQDHLRHHQGRSRWRVPGH